MRTTEVSPKRFSVLSALMPGPRTIAEIRRLIGWASTQSEFYYLQETLVRLELVTKHRGDSRTIILRITDTGRQQWRESADFYLHLIELANLAESPRLLSSCQTNQAPAPKPVRHERRLPTPEELQKLRDAAQPHERLAWDILRASLLPLDTLFALDVKDVDLQQSRITIRKPDGRPRSLAIEAPLRHALTAAIGDRSNGPALLWGDGIRWKSGLWHRCWKRLRTRAGVPPSVISRYRPTRFGQLPASAGGSPENSRAG